MLSILHEINIFWSSAVVICPWGAEGAAASDEEGKVCGFHIIG